MLILYYFVIMVLFLNQILNINIKKYKYNFLYLCDF